jgi:hypothetical protein
MKYIQLLSLEIVHDYYADRRCDDFHIIPTTETQKLLKNFRFVLKPYPGRMEIWAPVTAEDRLFIPLSTDTIFTFHLELQNPDFVLFTDLNNISASRGTQFTLTYPAAPPQKRNYFAEIEINFKYDNMAKLVGGKEFQVTFQPKQVRWKYYVITDNNLPAPTLEDRDKAVIFNIKDRIDLTKTPDLSDTIAQMLAEKHPDKKYYRFVSDSLLPCQQITSKVIQLQMGKGKVVDALPNPSIQKYTIDLRGSIKELTLYHIVKYFIR